MAVTFNPDGFNFGQDLQGGSADNIGGVQAGHFLEGRVYRQEAIVNRLSVLVADDFMHSASADHFVEQQPVFPFALFEKSFRFLAFRDVVKYGDDLAGGQLVNMVFRPKGQLFILIQRVGMKRRDSRVPYLLKDLEQPECLDAWKDVTDAFAGKTAGNTGDFFRGCIHLRNNEILPVIDRFIDCHAAVHVFEKLAKTRFAGHQFIFISQFFNFRLGHDLLSDVKQKKGDDQKQQEANQDGLDKVTG